MTTTYSSTSYSSYPNISHSTHPSLNKMVCHPLPQAFERKFSDSMYGAAFGFLLEAKSERVEAVAGPSQPKVRGQASSREVASRDRVCVRERTPEEWSRPKVDRRKSTQSERTRVLPPQKPIPSQPIPLPPTPLACSSSISLPLLPSRAPSPLKLDSDVDSIPHEAENVFITLSPQRKSPAKAYQDGSRPSIVSMAPLAVKSRTRSTRDDSIWV